MNAAEQEAVLALVRAATLDERSRAIQSLLYGNGVRLGDARDQLAKLNAETIHAANAARLRPLPAAHHGALVRVEPYKGPLVLSAHAIRTVDEWIESWRQIDKLLDAGCEHPGPLLLLGPPGTGKSSLAGTLGERLGVAAFVLDAHRVLQSHMGETSKALDSIFVAASESGLLILEEIDALGTVRMTGDGSGAAREYANITIALMRLLDTMRFPIVMTCNRSRLDPALFRRCEFKIELPEPDDATRMQIVEQHLGASLEDKADASTIPNLADAVPIAKRARRLAVLQGANPATLFVNLCDVYWNHARKRDVA